MIVKILWLIVILLIAPAVLAQDDDFDYCMMAATMEYGDTEAEEITNRKPLFLACFEGEEGDEVVISMMATDGSLDPYIFLTSPDLSEIYGFHDDISRTNKDSRLEFTLPEDGYYMITATRFNVDEGTTEGEFELTIELASSGGGNDREDRRGDNDRGGTERSDPAEVIDFCEDATTIEYGDTVEDNLSDDLWVLPFCFEGSEGDTIIIEMISTNDSLDPFISLHNDSLTANYAESDDAENSSRNSRIEFTLPEDGIYLISASRYEQEDGSTRGKFALTLTLSSAGEESGRPIGGGGRS